jgi:hypothetical protein
MNTHTKLGSSAGALLWGLRGLHFQTRQESRACYSLRELWALGARQLFGDGVAFEDAQYST